MKFEFEDFVLDINLAELRRGDKQIPIEPRVFDLLVFLIQNSDRVLSRDEIVEKVWDGRFVSDSAISSSIKSLRQVLGDDGEAQRVIKTVRGRGFRFVASLNRMASAAPAAAAAPGDPGSAGVGRAPDRTGMANGKPSIVVIPFRSMSAGVADQILSEAVPHELIQALSKLRWLRVIARGSAFRFSAENPALSELSDTLDVRYALLGTINQIGDDLIVTIELSDCKTDEVVWAERFETRPENLNDIRTSIVAEVIASLEIYIPENEARSAEIKSPESLDAWANYHLGLRNMYRFSKDHNAKAVSLFERAIRQDPTFARAYAGLSFARFQDAFIRYTPDVTGAIADARRFAEKSVEIDPYDPFSNFTMGRSFWLEKDPAAGLNWLERAVTLSPNYAQGHYSRAFAQTMTGEANAALENADLAQSLSPLDPMLYAMHGVRAFSFLREDQLEEAVEQAELAARAPGAHFLILMIAAMAHSRAGNRDRVGYWHDLIRAKRPDADQKLFFAAFPFSGDEFRQRLSRYLEKAGFS